MSFLTALAEAAGGYARGRQQRFQNQLAQQQQADTHAYEQGQIASENERNQIAQAAANREQETYQRNLGIDPTTGKPFVLPPNLQRIVPRPVGANYQATPQDLAAHYWSLAQYYAGTGQLDKAKLAQSQAAGIQQEMMREYSEAEINQRQQNSLAQQRQLLPIREQFSIDQQGRAQNFSQSQQGRAQGFQAAQQQRSFGNQMKLHLTPTAQQQWQRSAKSPQDAVTAIRTSDRELDNSVRQQLSTLNTQNISHPGTHANMDAFSQILNQSISDVRKDPGSLNAIIQKMQSSTMDMAQKSLFYTAVGQAAHNAESARQAQQALTQANKPVLLPPDVANPPAYLPPPPPPQ